MRNRWLPVTLVAATLTVGLLALVWTLAAGPSEAQSGSMHNCPPAGKWSIAVWEGDSGAAADAALATCGAGTVSAAYSLDPQTGGWSRWFAGKPDVSNLPPLDDLQGVLALGAAGGPVVTATPAGTPAPGTGDVTLVSSDAFSVVKDADLTVVGELRNDSSEDRTAGEIGIRFYDGAGQQVGYRKTLAFDNIIRSGRTTAFRETLPSSVYWSNETNVYPVGWTRYEITLSPYAPPEYHDKPVDITVENVQVTDGGLHVTGNAVNASSKTAPAYEVSAYVIYRREDGSILNAREASVVNFSPLAPSGSVPFDIMFSSDEPVDFSSYIVQAYAEAE